MRLWGKPQVAVVILLALSSSPGWAQFTTLETEQLRLVYFDPSTTYLAPHVARCYENAMQFHRKLWDYDPWERTTVLMTDFADYGNAGAESTPRGYVALQVAPTTYVYEAYPSNERMNQIMNHELVHVVATDKAAGSDRFFRKFFAGKVRETADHPETILYQYLTGPRNAAPRWYHEGIAVFVETWMSGGIGQAQGSWDEMVFRSMVRDDSHFYDPLGLVSEGVKVDFQLEQNSYLYGTRFMSYLAHTYSPEDVVAWVSRSDGTKRYYAKQFKETFGKPLAEAWQDWIDFEHEFQNANLEGIRQNPITPYRDISERALGSVSRAFYDAETDQLYAAFNYPGVVSHIGAISLADGTVDKIRDVKGPAVLYVTSMAYDPSTKDIFYTADNYAHRDLVAVNAETRDYRMLIKDARIGDLVFNPGDRSLWGIRHLNGFSTMVRIPEPYDDWFQVYTWPYGQVPYDLDISPDGKLLAFSVGQINGDHLLQVVEIDSITEDSVPPIAELDFGTTIPSNFVFDESGRFLYGSSYYTGVSNLFRFEVATEQFEALSNTETGLFRPVPIDDERLVAFRYTGPGFVPTQITPTVLEDVSAITYFGERLVDKHPQVKDWILSSPAQVPLEEKIIKEGTYRGLRGIELESMYPVVEGYKNSQAVGMRFNLSDPLALNKAHITASISPDGDLEESERLHLDLKYQRYNWRTRFTLNDADFYDLFGPTKVSRKGYSLGLGYDKSLIFDSPRTLDLSVGATAFGNIERLPDSQNVSVAEDELYFANIGLSYSNRRASLGAVDHEKGIKAGAYVTASYAGSEFIPAAYANFDFGFALPLHHSSIWIRNSAGAAIGELDDPFANFFFGGFGNNYVDHQSIKRYREGDSFPGVELNAIGGRNYARTMVEWNLPPLRFRRAGSPGFYLTWARTSLFATGIETNLDRSEADRRVANVGVQVDLRLTLLARLNMTVSLGYARAFESGLDTEDEFLASLRILQ